MMFMPIASGPRPQGLNLGGGDTKDKLMIGGLVLIIVVAAVALVISIAGGGADGSGEAESPCERRRSWPPAPSA